MEPEVPLQCLQGPTTDPNPEPDEPSPHSPTLISLRSIIILSSHVHLCLPSGLFPSGFPTELLYASPMHATYPIHLIFLDFITQIKHMSYEAPHYSVFSSLLLLPPA